MTSETWWGGGGGGMFDRGNLAVSTVGGVRPAATAASELPGEAPRERGLLDWPSPSAVNWEWLGLQAAGL